MKETIKKINLDSEFPTDERCFIIETSNSSDDPNISISRARVESGVTTCWHLLRKTSERYYIINGRGSVEVGNLPPQEVLPGDIVIIPPDCRQRITNTGKEDLIFLVICSPRFTVGAYQDLEEKLN